METQEKVRFRSFIISASTIHLVKYHHGTLAHCKGLGMGSVMQEKGLLGHTFQRQFLP